MNGRKYLGNSQQYMSNRLISWMDSSGTKLARIDYQLQCTQTQRRGAVLDTALNTKVLDPNKVWSVANGGIKLVDFTKDMLADFEAYKKDAAAHYGSADDPYASSSADTGGQKAIYAFRLTDVDPTSWSPQWVNADGTSRPAPPTSDSGPSDYFKRIRSILSVNDEKGPEQLQWSRRVLESWLAKQNAGGTSSETAATASSSAILAAQRTYDRSSAAASA